MEMSAADGTVGEAPVLLVGIANPETAPHLVDLAACLARHAGYALVATQVVTVPPQALLSSARGSPQIAAARDLLRSAVRAAAEQGVRSRAVMEVARNVHEGVISAAATQRAELILVGYSDSADGPGRSRRAFDRIAHHLARGTRCDLIVAKFRQQRLRSILIPVAAGTSLRLSGRIARAVRAAKGANVRFLHVAQDEAERAKQHARITALLQEHGLQDLGDLEVIVSEDVMSAIVERANQHDLAIVGAEPHPSLVNSIFGSPAEHIATEADCTVLVVRAQR